MSILVFSPDDDAAEALCAALSRLNENNRRVTDRQQAAQACAEFDPLVVVTDVAAEGYFTFVEQTARKVPWRRNFLITDRPKLHRLEPLIPSVEKPFDASEFAALLSRERELSDWDRRQRSTQAQAQENALLVKASFEAIIGLSPDGVIVSWNPGAQQIYGYVEAEILGQHVGVLEIDPNALQSPLAPAQVVEAKRRRKDGRELPVLLSRSVVEPSPESTRLGYVEVSLDISVRHELERELEHSKRLATIGRLSAAMSHEINNPLAVIRSSSNWLCELAQREGNLELQEAAQDMEVAAERIFQFADQICGFARRSQGKLLDGPLQPTLDMALRMVRPRAAEKRVTVTQGSVDPVQVAHDAPRLAQVIINVLANAIDAAAEGGKSVTLRAYESGAALCVEVDDNGPGIAEEIRDQLFQPFSTTKPFGKGTGLGLALSRKIIEDHHGTIELIPMAGGGTRAQIQIPRSAQHTGKPSTEGSASRA